MEKFNVLGNKVMYSVCNRLADQKTKVWIVIEPKKTPR